MAIKQLNDELKEVRLNQHRVKVRTRPRPKANGRRVVEVMAEWDPLNLTTTGRGNPRPTDIELDDSNWVSEVAKIRPAVDDLIRQAEAGSTCRSERGRPPSLTHVSSGSQLGRQLKEAREAILIKANPNATLRDGSRGRKCAPEEIDRHMKCLDNVAAGLVGDEFTLTNACRVLLKLHERGGQYTSLEAQKKKAYKDDVDTMKFVCREMGLELRIPVQLAPAYRYTPSDRNIPDDSILCKRIKAIKNKYHQQLIYAVVAYGKRNSEIYSMGWEDMKHDHVSQLVTTYSPKNGKSGLTWQIPFGDEEISLRGFVPPQWDELKLLSGKRSEATKPEIKKISAEITTLCQDYLGCDPTDLRHRWACKSLMKNDVHAVSSAMGTSVQMLQKTYSREINQYKMQHWSPNV